MVGYSLILGLHVACGVAGLISMPAPLVAPKGSPVHRWSGRAFAAAMVGAGLSGMALAALWIAVPERIHPTPAGEDPAAHAAALRTYGSFLGYVGWLTLSGAWTGIRAFRRRGPPGLVDRLLPGGRVAGGVALGLLGAIDRSWLFLAFALFGTAFGVRELAGLGRPFDRRAVHGRAMLGTAMAAVTAFLALGARRWFDVHAVFGPVIWLGPLLIGFPLARWMLGRPQPAAV